MFGTAQEGLGTSTGCGTGAGTGTGGTVQDQHRDSAGSSGTAEDCVGWQGKLWDSCGTGRDSWGTSGRAQDRAGRPRTGRDGNGNAFFCVLCLFCPARRLIFHLEHAHSRRKQYRKNDCRPIEGWLSLNSETWSISRQCLIRIQNSDSYDTAVDSSIDRSP